METRFPLEQKVRNPAEAFQLAFARSALQLIEESAHLRPQASHEGLVMLGCNEASLEGAVGILLARYGNGLTIDRPRVRYIQDGTLQEPIMALSVDVPLRYSGVVRSDLRARAASISEMAIRGGHCAIEAQAPLAEVIGYGKALDRLTNGTGDHSMRLLRYAPLEPNPGGDAA